jgi:hypothetical protein
VIYNVTVELRVDTDEYEEDATDAPVFPTEKNADWVCSLVGMMLDGSADIDNQEVRIIAVAEFTEDAITLDSAAKVLAL